MKTLGILGLGAFGQFAVKHLALHFNVVAYDPAPRAAAFARQNGIAFGTLKEAAQADVVILAVPIDKLKEAVRAIKPHLKKGAIVCDVASVKVRPAELLQKELPESVNIVCTHPLFGPQSGKNGIKGLKIAVCPIRGRGIAKIRKFLQAKLGLRVIMTTPAEHDREVAAVQGLTHMIAKVLVAMEPLPKKMTTKSFDLMMDAIEMVRHDSMELFLAIERDNPFSAKLRHKFFKKAEELRTFLEAQDR